MKEPKGSGANRLYAELRDRILDLEFAPGEPLEEAVIEGRFGVSRTLVREAFIRLASEGLVEQSRNRGARVAPIGLSALPQYFEALDLVQRAVTRWAAVRRTAAQMQAIAAARDTFETLVQRGDGAALNDGNTVFHDAIGAACGNMHLERQYRLLLAEGVRMARLTLVYAVPNGTVAQDHLALIVTDHRAMADAIEQGDAARAEALAGGHVGLFRSRVDAYFAQNLAPAVAVTRAA